jgi:hypothetical protein
MAQSWPNHGPIMAQSWTTIGPPLDHHWTTIGPPLDHHWTTIGPGPGLGHDWTMTWPNHGPIMAQSWPNHGPIMDHHWTTIGPPLDHHWTTIGPPSDHHRIRPSWMCKCNCWSNLCGPWGPTWAHMGPCVAHWPMSGSILDASGASCWAQEIGRISAAPQRTTWHGRASFVLDDTAYVQKVGVATRGWLAGWVAGWLAPMGPIWPQMGPTWIQYLDQLDPIFRPIGSNLGLLRFRQDSARTCPKCSFYLAPVYEHTIKY